MSRYRSWRIYDTDTYNAIHILGRDIGLYVTAVTLKTEA